MVKENKSINNPGLFYIFKGCFLYLLHIKKNRCTMHFFNNPLCRFGPHSVLLSLPTYFIGIPKPDFNVRFYKEIINVKTNMFITIIIYLTGACVRDCVGT